MLMTHPDVSVLIPTHNRKAYLRQAVESCFAGNEGIAVEVVVVDDGSTDGTREYLRSIDDARVRPVFQDQAGPQVARNRGMEHIRGRYVKHLDDDDYLLPGSLKRQTDALDRTGCCACYGDPHVLYEDEKRKRTLTLNSYTDLLIAISSGSKGIHTWNLLFLLDAQIARKCLWDEDLNHLHILSYLLAFSRYETSCLKVEAPVAVHRIHSGSRVSHEADETTVEREREFTMYESALADIEVNAEQERALIEAMWLEVHMIAPYDWTCVSERIKEIVQAYPHFYPERRFEFLSLLDRLIGVYATERLVNPLRKIPVRR